MTIEAEVFPYRWTWRWRTWVLPGVRARVPWFGDGIDRTGRACRVVTRGTRNSALLEFEDGYQVVTSRGGLRRLGRERRGVSEAAVQDRVAGKPSEIRLKTDKGDITLAMAWHADRVLLAVEAADRMAEHEKASLTAGDLVIDAHLERAVEAAHASHIGDAFTEQNGWDPRTYGDRFVFLVLKPDRIRVRDQGPRHAGPHADAR